MKYIEFIGAPGAGKSTVAREAISILQRQQRQVYDKYAIRRAAMACYLRQQRGTLWQIANSLKWVGESFLFTQLWERQQRALFLWFMAAYPQFARCAIECAEYTRPPAWIPRDVISTVNLLDWFFDAAAYYQAAQEYLPSDAIILVEESFSQHAYYLLAFYQGALNDDCFLRYFQACPKPDALIALLPSPEECEERLHRRLKGVSSDILTPLTVPQRMEVLQERTVFNEKIAAYWEQYAVQVIRLENRDYQQTQRILAERLSSAL